MSLKKNFRVTKDLTFSVGANVDPRLIQLTAKQTSKSGGISRVVRSTVMKNCRVPFICREAKKAVSPTEAL